MLSSLNFSNYVFYRKGSNPRSCVMPSCHISLVSVSLEHPSFLGFQDLKNFEYRAVILQPVSQFGFIHYFLIIGPGLCIFWQNYHRGDVAFSFHAVRWHTMLICSLTSHGKCDHLIKIISARFLWCKIIFFLYD